MKLSRACGWMALALSAAACAASSSTPLGTTSGGSGAGTTTKMGSGAGTTTTTSTTTGMGGGSLFDAGTGGGAAICNPDNEAMYLFGSTAPGTASLYKFLPKTLSLTMVGAVNCGTTANPFAMSVDRNVVAWALYDNGQIFKIDTSTAACTQTGFLAGQQGFTTFGMGFVADQQNTGTETLFITQADSNPADDQLGSLDTTMAPPTLTLVGHYSGADGGASPIVGPADATGTGDGRLYGFFATSPAQLAQIDKSTAQILKVDQLPGVTTGLAWAFAFWGGTFWLFTWNGSASGSTLQQYDPTTMAVTQVSAGIGPVVVGAGVSTCAPLTPPK